ncbi:HAD-IIB family hydrolase [Nocardioides sp. TRM66260-LWL]|uniref:HAD family hydrolase n=1 Tax=Nocardioides sp. TRM66260-LWL TaxID=2874478 RepID=UPI001CC4DB3D|nr:HAD-IIB family hydrolase [Nocardioides sp. TRM66260-LWL]MBZ5735442.1 HAD-IIB family hydrolase [Nocardioides sp. TRM66260-LWL]
MTTTSPLDLPPGGERPLPRLVATDLDGTLVRSDGSVSPYTRAVLTALEQRGVPVVFVTGRPLRWAAHVFDHVGEHGLAIISNGAAVWDVAADAPRLVRDIEPALALEVAEEIRAAVPGSAFAVEDLVGIGLEPTFMERVEIPDVSRRAPLADLLDRRVLKLLARHEELDAQEYWDRAEAVSRGRLTITWSSSSTLLEISAPDVTKASTLELLCAELGLGPADVVAFGDMPNDLPMLGWAGLSYAMADAHPSVREVAGRTAPGHDEDGVAQVLSGLFGLGLQPGASD